MAPSSAYWTLACKYDSLAFGPDFVGDRVALHQALGIARSESAEVTPNAI